MTADSTIYRDLAYVFVAAVLGGFLARKLRQPLILGYVLGGILIGPFTPGPTVSEIRVLELFAEIGVILLMYSIGLEFSFRDLLRVKWVALVGGPLGILVSIGLSMAVGNRIGWTTSQGIAVGAIVSVASTMVLSRFLIDRGELHSPHGRVMIGITLVEDFAVVMLTILLPALGSLTGSRFFGVGLALGKSLLILALLAFIASKMVPRLMAQVARTRNQELYLLVALALGFATAAVTQALGLSLALGAFLAGMVISESPYAHQTFAQLLPLRDAFVALFFVTIGALINPRALISDPLLLGVIVALIVLGKFVIWTVVARLFRYPIWTAVLVGAGLTQIGEFSYILVQVARKSGLVGNDVYNAVLAASLLTILLNALLMRMVPEWIGRHRLIQETRALTPAHEPKSLNDHVVVCGFGRVGGALGAALDAFEVPYVVIEIDPDIVDALRERGIPSLFGDSVHANILKEAGIERCRLVVVTLPETDWAVLAVRNVRGLNAEVSILARAHRPRGREELLKAGATEVIQPEFEASVSLIQHSLDRLDVPLQSTLSYLEGFREGMETTDDRKR
ncbi:MAG: cation:proton antiporter [Candidatus Acidiferrales bacterium]